MHKEKGAWVAAETQLPSYFYPRRWFALLPSIAEHWAINLTSFPRTICPRATLLYFPIPPLAILLPKAFCYLFHCPPLFPYCLCHLFILVAFSFLAVGLHTVALPSLPFPPSSLHPYAFAPCPASPCWSSPLPQFAFTQLEPCCSPCSHTAPLHLAHSRLPQQSLPHSCGPNACSSENFAIDRHEPRTWLCKSKLSWVCTHFSGTHGASSPSVANLALNSAASVQKVLHSNHSLNFRITPLRKEKDCFKNYSEHFGMFQGKQHNK